MAYAQWATFTIKAKNCNISIKNPIHQWGKFYDGINKDKEIAAEDIDRTLIKDRQEFTFGACGRSDAASGTEGSFDLYDGETLVASYSWDCPWGSKTNTSSLTVHQRDDYLVQLYPSGNLNSGALGNVGLTIARI
jgi:hypothetical protein